jgi:hypothetical protein
MDRTRVLGLLFLLAIFSCKPEGKSKVAQLLEIDEPQDWILVIHPEGCKTCLDQLYQELSQLQTANGVIVIVAKNTKTLRLNPLFGQSLNPIHLDEEKKLIQEGIVDFQDQILLFSADELEKFEILNYETLLTSLRTF